MKNIIKLTETDLRRIVKKVLKEETESFRDGNFNPLSNLPTYDFNNSVLDMDNDLPDNMEVSKKNNNPITGIGWRSCKYWNGGNNIKYGNMFNFTKTPNLIEVEYSGPSKGISIAHANNSEGDTIHQVFNVLICEMNPYLSSINAKPDINNIYFTTGKNGNDYKLKISIPLENSDKPYQLNRRGGWGHTSSDGKREMENTCKNKTGCYGPITHVANGPFGKITEHFITYPL